MGALLVGTGCAAGLVLAAAPAANALPTGCMQAAETVTCTYSATGSTQTFTPPTGVTSANVSLTGGSGGKGGALVGGGAGGDGATVSGSLSGLTGALTVYVGSRGQNGSVNGTGGAGGFGYGSGGAGGTDVRVGGGGGGASAVVAGSTTLAVAAGGGGGGAGALGGAGGASAGAGTTGDLAHGGVGGTAGTSGSVTGGTGGSVVTPGGGGGGGVTGGSGGHASSALLITGGGGGGGGTDLAPTGGTVTDGTNSGAGQVVISYTLPPLAITTTSLPAASVGVAYSATLDATGATPPYGWAITSGSLPPGLSLNTATGVISGTPTTPGNYTFNVQATDSATPASSVTVTLSIAVGPVVSSVSPNWGLPGGGGITRINGAGLDCAGCHVRVMFGNAPATVLFASPTQLTVDAPPGHGTVNVTVTVNGVTSATSSAGTYTYY